MNPSFKAINTLLALLKDNKTFWLVSEDISLPQICVHEHTPYKGENYLELSSL